MVHTPISKYPSLIFLTFFQSFSRCSGSLSKTSRTFKTVAAAAGGIAAEKIRNILDVEAKPVTTPEKTEPVVAAPAEPQPVVAEEKKVQDEFISDLELALRELEQF